MNFKKTIALSLAALAIIGLAGCGGGDKKAASSAASSAQVKNEISVGVTPGYSEEVVEFVVGEAKKQGLTVIVRPFSDYVTPDQALLPRVRPT